MASRYEPDIVERTVEQKAKIEALYEAEPFKSEYTAALVEERNKAYAEAQKSAFRQNTKKSPE